VTGLQSVLDPAGAGGASIAALWWAMFGMGTLVFLGVVIALFLAVRRREGTELHTRAGDRLDTPDDRRARRFVIGAVAASLAVLLVTFTLSLFTSRATAALAEDGAPEIEVTGIQWWWDIRYLDSDPSRVVRVANELHLPAGRSVRIKLRSRDVIHSFWVPSIAGKLDVMPGRENELWVRATVPGTYRGQCAEFCGLQHAKMSLMVVVHTPADYEKWLAAELQPASPPASALAVTGETVFMRNPCSACHAIRGTDAYGQAGPDLTHLGRRLSLAAGELPNTAANRAAWITAPQEVKPGAHMPDVGLDPTELEALLAYLDGLK